MSFLIYGANGYTGRLIAREAMSRGHRPVLAGRNRAELEALAAQLGLPGRVAGLDDPKALQAALGGIGAVVHCAGPFSHTSAPMAEACLRTGVHYLDITGEIAVFEALAARDQEARSAGVTLLPGVGFDVVPSDCLALHLKERLPSATSLTLAFQTRGAISRGTALTAVEGLGEPGCVRRNGVLTSVPGAWKTREVEFGGGPRPAVTIPWGDVSTAWYTTGIGNIEVYIALPGNVVRVLRRTRPLGWLLGSAPIRAVLSALVRARLTGPSEQVRRAGETIVWGEVADAAGRRVAARLHGPEGYTFTAHAAVRAVERILGGGVKPGFMTPGKAFGADFALAIPGVERIDLPAA
jgi:short subunit dehydrogenase-like uncharacterized protein